MILNNYTTYGHASTPATVQPTWHLIRKRQEKKNKQKHVPLEDCNVRGKGGKCQLEDESFLFYKSKYRVLRLRIKRKTFCKIVGGSLSL